MIKTVSAAAHKHKKNSKAATSKQKAVSASRAHRRNLYIAAAALVAVVLICYANSLGNGFVFDDKQIILDNRLLRSISNLPKLLVISYRPLRDVTHTLDFAVWGENPFGFHLTNILIHTANAVLVLFLFRRLTGKISTATFGALVFAVHPLQTDAVTYISGRRDILFSLFYLASFHTYLNYRRNRSRVSFALFILFWGLSLLSKEMAVTLPLFIFVWNFCDAWGETVGGWWVRLLKAIRTAFRRDWWLYITLSLAALAYAWYQTFVKGGSRLAGSGLKFWGGSFYTNMLLAVRVQAWYLKQLVLPTPRVQYKGTFDISTTLLDWRVVLSIIVVGAVLAAGLFSLNRNKLISFAILSYFVLLLPVSQIIPHHELLADHYLYLPVLSFALVAGLLVQQVAEPDKMARRLAYGAAAGVTIVFAVVTISRNAVWKDDITLWQTSYRESPNSVRAASALAKAYANIYPHRAEELYKRCLEIDPGYGAAYYSLAVLSKNDRKKPDEVEKIIQEGLTLPESKVLSSSYAEDLSMFRAQLKTAMALTKINKSEFERDPAKKDELNKQAVRLLEDAITIYPGNPLSYTLLATYYSDASPDKAVEVLQRMVNSFPTYPQPLETISDLLIGLKRYDEAAQYLERLLNLVPGDFYANYQLSRVYRSKGECTNARAYLNAARSAALKVSQTSDVQKAQNEIDQECVQ